MNVTKISLAMRYARMYTSAQLLCDLGCAKASFKRHQARRLGAAGAAAAAAHRADIATIKAALAIKAAA